MKQWTFNIGALLWCLSAQAVFAADATNDSHFGNAEMQQQVELAQDAPRPNPHKHMQHKKAMKSCAKGSKGMGWKEMDGNHDGKISKEEFMSYHEQKFEQMKQADGMLDISNMKHPTHAMDMPAEANTNSMNNKPLGTTSGNEAVNPKDATNGKKF